MKNKTICNIEKYLSTSFIDYDIEESMDKWGDKCITIFFENMISKEKLSGVIDDLVEMAAEGGYKLKFSGI